MIKHKSPISGVSTYQTSYIATAGYDNQVVLWDARTHKSLARGLHDHLANSCTFSPCGQYVASASSDYSVRMWRLPEMRLEMIFKEADDDIEMVSFHPQQKILAACSRDHHIYIFDYEGRLLKKLAGHAADVISVTWSVDGDELISSSDDGTIKRWNLAEGRLIETLDLGGMETDSVVITPKGTIFAGNDAGEIVQNQMGSSRLFSFQAHRAGIKRLVYHEVTGRLVSLSYDRTFAIWDVRDGIQRIGGGEFPAVIWPRSCSFLGNDTLVFATFGDQYALYDIEDESWNLSYVGDTPGLNRVLVSEGRALTVGDAGVVKENTVTIGQVGSLCNFVIDFGSNLYAGGQLGQIFDVKRKTVAYTFRSPLNCAVKSDSRLFVGTYTGEVLVFEERNEDLVLVATVQAHENAIKGIAISQELLFTVCATGAVSFHSLKYLMPLGDFDGTHDRIANGCVFVKDQTFASVSRDLTLRLWTPVSCDVVPSPHQHSIKCVTADDEGRFICTGAYDGHIAVYDLQRRNWLPKEKISASGISSLTYDAAKRQFLASSYDGNLYPVAAP